MNLANKKDLAAKTLRVGKGRIIFKMDSLSEIKEAITRQDIKSLRQDGAIGIKPIKGRKKVVKRKTRRGPGKIKKKVNKRKQIYVKITRKLRSYIMRLRDNGDLDRELYKKMRNKIRMREFKSKANMKEFLKNLDVKVDEVVKKKKTASSVSKDTEGHEKKVINESKDENKSKEKGK